MLLPVRDAAPYLRECLASLADQSLADHEVVAVDDGSRDGSREILAAAAWSDPRVRVVSTTDGERGLVPALNAGLALAQSPLVARMDADDVAHLDRLAIQVKRLEEDPAVDVLGSRVRLISDIAQGNAGMRGYVSWLNSLVDHDAIASDLFVESPLAHPSVAMRTATLRALHGYRDFDGPEDYDLWLRAHSAGLRFGKAEEVLLDWRDTAGRLSRTDLRYSPDRFRALKIEALLSAFPTPDRPFVVWGAGPIGKAWSRDLTAAGRRVSAFIEVDPDKIGQAIHGAPVLPVSEAALVKNALHLAAVGDAAARQRIRAEAARMGLVTGRDVVAVA